MNGGEIDQPADLSAQPDGLLRLLVHGINETYGDVTISLLVGGSWVTGMLVPPRRWLEEYSEELTDYSSGDVSVWRQTLKLLGSGLYPSDSEREVFEREEGEPHPHNADGRYPWFAHLRDAHVFMGSQPVPVQPTFVRVRLSRVDAWTLGSFSVG